MPTQPTVQNELFTRLTSCAKTATQWANVVNTPLKGELCLEVHENAESVTGLPYTYRLKIGDGDTTYANLPYYGDFVTLHTANNAALAVARWNSTDSRMEFYSVTETNGIVALEATPALALKAGDKVTLTAATVGGVLVTSVNHSAQAAGDITEDTATLTDGGSFKVATGKDSYGHINKWTTFTLPNIATAVGNAISELDSDVSTSDNVHVLVGITEEDGKLSDFGETEIVGGDKLSVVGASGSITVNHDTTTVPAPSGTPTQLSDNGEFTIYSGNDTYGHVNQKTTLKLPDMAGIANTEIGKLDSSVSTTGNAKVLVGVTQTDGKLSAKDEKEVVGEQKITVEGTSTQIKVKHNTQTIGTDTAETLTDGGSFTVYSSVDDYGHVTKTKVFTLPSIATLIAALDSSQEVDGNDANKSVLRGVTEVDGKLTSHKQTTFVNGTKTTVTGSAPDSSGNNTIQINHTDIDTSATDASSGITTDGSSTEGEKELNVITGMKVDAQGHVTHIDKDISTNLVAADIKAPVKRQDDTTWNFRETGGDISIGEDTARIPSLKGNTIVWNQMFNDKLESFTLNGITFDFAQGQAHLYGTTTANVYRSLCEFINNHKYYLNFRASAYYNASEQPYWAFYNASGSAPNLNSEYKGLWSVATTDHNNASIITNGSAGFKSGSIVDITANITAIDLTKMFGAGNEPSTVEEFEKLFPNSYYPYCEGRLVNLGGYGVKWNQILQEIHYTITLTAGGYSNLSEDVAYKGGHKYYMSKSQTFSSTRVYIQSDGFAGWCALVGSQKSSIFTASSDFTGKPFWGNGSEDAVSIDSYVNIIDLTEMFGPGSEPTLEEFEAMFPEDYYEYNAGTEMNIFDAIGDKKLGLESTGFNLFDESTLQTGKYRDTSGVESDNEGRRRSDVYFPCLPSTDYYFYTSSGYAWNVVVCWYDNNKQFIVGTSAGNYIKKSPANAAYFRISNADDLTCNICVNISDTAKNGTYEPYKKDTLDLDWIREIEYIPSGSSTPEKLFPYGLLSAGNVHDEAQEGKLIKRVGVVDLGELTGWSYSQYTSGQHYFICPLNNSDGDFYNITTKNTKYTDSSWSYVFSNEIDKCLFTHGGNGNVCVTDSSIDESVISGTPGTSSATIPMYSGILLYYELATPVEIPLDQPHIMSYVVDDHGTEQQLPVNVSSVINAPFRGTFEYMSNFKDTVLRIIDEVNNYRNPVRGADNSAQAVGKLAEYDSDSTVRSSVYSASNATIVPTGENNEVILPTVAALVAYVQQIATSPLDYQGTVASYAALPSSGTKAGDVYILSQNDTQAGYQAGDWFVRNKANTGWDVIQGTISVTNSNPTLTFNGNTYTVGYVEGTPLQVTTPNLQLTEPTASGTADNLQVITSVSQSNGQLSAQKRTIPDASTSQKGVTSFVRDIHGATETNKVPSAKQAWDEFAKRNVSAVPVAPVPTPPPTSEYYASYQLEQSSSPDFTVTNKNFAEAYAASMGGYLFYVKNGVVYAAKLKASDWTKFADGTTVTSAVRAATETMIHVPTCRYKASGTTMKFGGLNPLFGGNLFNSPQWVGAYQMDADGHSRPGVGSGHSKTMSQFWNLAQTIHTGFGLANYEFHNLINALYQALNGNLNSEYVLSNGNSRSSDNWDKYRDLAHGYSDTIGDGSGCVQAVDASGTTRYVTRLCGFEDLFGKLWEFRSGIRFYMNNGVRYAVVYDGNQVSNTAEGRVISGVLASANGEYITAMECGEHWDMLPKSVGGSSTTYYCDGYWAATSGQLLCVGGRASYGSRCGLACAASGDGFSSADASLGARLAFYEEPVIVSGAELVALMA